MARRIERLIYVHSGDPGRAGVAVRECHGSLLFNAEGSGLLHVDGGPEALEPAPDAQSARAVPIDMMRRSQLDPLIAELVGDETPCIVARGPEGAAIVVRKTAIARCHGTPSDLRGKIRFGAARIGWEL